MFARDEARARSVAKLCGAEPFTDADALIGHAAVDAIDVCLPSAVHAALRGFGAGAGQACVLRDARWRFVSTRRGKCATRPAVPAACCRSDCSCARSLPTPHVRDAVSSGAHGRLLSLATWRLGSYLRSDAADRKAHYGDPSTELMTFDFDARTMADGPAGAAVGQCRADGGRDAGRDFDAARLERRPSCHDHRQRHHACRLSVLDRLSRPVRSARPSSFGWCSRAEGRLRAAFTIVDEARRRPRPVAIPEAQSLRGRTAALRRLHRWPCRSAAARRGSGDRGAGRCRSPRSRRSRLWRGASARQDDDELGARLVMTDRRSYRSAASRTR